MGLMSEIIDSFLVLGKKKEAKTTGFVFRMLTSYSFGLLSVCVATVLAAGLFGGAIECFPGNPTRFKDAIQLTCWIEGVFHDNSLRTQNAFPGIGAIRPGVGSNHRFEDIDRITFKYHQWIIPMLILQTIIFRLPFIFWQSSEKSTMFKLLGDVWFPVFSEKWEKQRKALVTYLKDVKAKYHRQYALKYLLAEILAFLALLFNVMLTKWIIQHEKTSFWSGYASAVGAFLRGDFSSFNFHASLFFPIYGKCEFNKSGPSGTIEINDALCLLPHNVINDKVFVIIYVWYVVAIVCGIINLVYLLVMFLSPFLRICDIGEMLERSATVRECKNLSRNGDFGMWFSLKTMNRNLVSIQFQDLCKELAKEFKNEPLTIGCSTSSKGEDIEKY